jgi:hypothetical protein
MIAESTTGNTATRPVPAARGQTAREPRAALAYGATCPECGGAIRINEGDRSLRCRYCGSALLIPAPRGIQSYILQPKVTAAKARLTSIRYIAEETKNRVRGRNTSIIDMKLIHVPFWRMRGRLMGWFSGDRSKLVRIETGPDDPRAGQPRTTVREEHEACSRLLFKRVDWSTPACTLPCLGLQGISLRTGFLEWDVLDEKRRAEHTVALPTRSERTVRADALGYLTRLAIPAGTTVRASRFHLFDSRFSLYYYPVFVLRYRFAGRTYTITLDGGNGSVVRGEVPAERRTGAKRLFFVPAVFAFLAVTWLPLVIIPIAVLYGLDTAQARRFLPPHCWLAPGLQRLLGGED